MSETTVSDHPRDDDEREEVRAPSEHQHRDAANQDTDENDTAATESGESNVGLAAIRSDNDGQASIEAGIREINGPIDLHDIYLRVRGQSLLHVLLALLALVGLCVGAYWTATAFL